MACDKVEYGRGNQETMSRLSRRKQNYAELQTSKESNNLCHGAAGGRSKEVKRASSVRMRGKRDKGTPDTMLKKVWYDQILWLVVVAD